MPLPTKVYNAIKWYCDKMDYTPMLMPYPTLVFQNRNGEIIEMQATVLLAKYENRGRATID